MKPLTQISVQDQKAEVVFKQLQQSYMKEPKV